MAKKNETPAARRARMERLARDPRTRAAVPTEFLSAKHRRVRALNARLNAPVTAGSEMREVDLARQANAETDAKYREPTRLVREEEANAAGRLKAAPTYFEQYKATLDAARARLDQEREATLAAAGGRVSAAADPTQAQQAVQQGAQQFGYDPAQATQAAAAGAATRGALAGSARDVLAAQFAGRGGVLDEARTTGVESRRAKALAEAAAALGKVQTDRRELAKERGEYNISARDKGRSAERQSVLERIALQIKDADSQRDARTAKADREMSAEEKRKEREAEAREKKRDRDLEKSEGQKDREAAAERDAAKGSKQDKPGAPRQEPTFSLQARNLILARARTISKLMRDQKITTRGEFKGATKSSRKGWYSPEEQPLTAAALDLVFNRNKQIASPNLHVLRDMGIYITTKGQYWAGGNRGS